MSTRIQDGLVELDLETSLRLLAEHHVGRVAVNDGNGPVVFPVNYAFDQGTVVFRTDLGTKLAAAERRGDVAFEVDHVDVGRRLGWSVLVRGRLSEVTDPDELDRLAALPLEPFVGGDKAHFVRVMPRTVTGRRIPIPDRIPRDWLQATGGNTWFGRDGDDLLA